MYYISFSIKVVRKSYKKIHQKTFLFFLSLWHSYRCIPYLMRLTFLFLLKPFHSKPSDNFFSPLRFVFILCSSKISELSKKCLLANHCNFPSFINVSYSIFLKARDWVHDKNFSFCYLISDKTLVVGEINTPLQFIVMALILSLLSIAIEIWLFGLIDSLGVTKLNVNKSSYIYIWEHSYTTT